MWKWWIQVCLCSKWKLLVASGNVLKAMCHWQIVSHLKCYKLFHQMNNNISSSLGRSKYKLLWKICQSKLSSRGKLLKIIIMQTHQQFILVIDQFVISCNLKLQQHFSLKSENISWITFVVLGHWSIVKSQSYNTV